MSRRREVDARLDTLGDIGKIMRSMRNLSYMETSKLARFLDSQRRVVAGIQAAAEDFHGHYPTLLDVRPAAIGLYVVVGTERGFCGSFNEAVLLKLQDCAPADQGTTTRLIAVGAKLASTLEGDPRLTDCVPGASTAEEVPAVLSQLVQSVNRLADARSASALTVVHWDAESRQVVAVTLLPPFQFAPGSPRTAFPFAPRLNLPPRRFLALLVEHYLFGALHELLYSSLMAEHQQRVNHLEGALERIDDRVQELALRRNALRQEEITEEIELILLNPPRM